jgi:hypothetical protein
MDPSQHEKTRLACQKVLGGCRCCIPDMSPSFFHLCRHEFDILRVGELLPFTECLEGKEKDIFQEVWKLIIWVDKRPPIQPDRNSGKGWSFVMQDGNRIRELLSVAGWQEIEKDV